MIAPVIIFVYNRPDHTKQTIEALAGNRLAKESEVFIFSDAAKNNADSINVNMTRNYIDSICNKGYFKKVEIIKAKKNKGLADSVIWGVSTIIEKHEKVIVLEDDLISKENFLEYMNGALDYYNENSSIWSISGFNLPILIPKNYKEDVYLSYRASSWGWATWKDRWEMVDWEVSDYNQFKKSKKMQKKFNRGGKDLSEMLDYQMSNKIDSWAIRWCYSQSKTEMYTIYPVKSKIKNIGLDGSGTHSGMTEKYNFEFEHNDNFHFNNIDLDKRITKRFSRHYMSNIGYHLRKIKRKFNNH